MGRLWIIDPDPSQRRSINWALRNRFDRIDEFENAQALELALQGGGPFDEMVEGRSDDWKLLTLISGEERQLTVVACRDEVIAEIVRSFVSRLRVT
jgi:hypothetical protein